MVIRKLDNIKRWFLNKYMLKVELLEDVDNIEKLSELSDILENAFTTVMANSNFEFNHYSDFVDNLKEVAECGGVTYVVKCGKKTVGTLSIKPMELEKWYHEGTILTLCHIGVLPEYQGYGIGRMLLDQAKTYSMESRLPMRLVTPEKNINAIKIYEKSGFKKIRMHKAGEHYAVLMINWNGNDAFSPWQCKFRYEISALNSLMRNWQICNHQSNPGIQKKWNKDFYEYIKDESDETREDMRKCFRSYGITPREYNLYKLKGKKKSQRSEYFSSRRMVQLNEIENIKKLPDSLHINKNAHSSQEMFEIVKSHEASVRAITVRNGDEVRVCFALLKLKKEGQNKANRFAGLDVANGKVTTSIYKVASGLRQLTELPLLKDQLNNWDELTLTAEKAAKKLDDIIVGVDLVYTKNGWVITDIARNPSLINVQFAMGGIKPKVEEFLGKELDERFNY